eukprot:6353686-Pyramimonas_sp.AAC.1
MGVELHADPATGTFGGAPYVATKCVSSGPELGGVTFCGPCRGDRRWSSLWATKLVRSAPRWVELHSYPVT